MLLWHENVRFGTGRAKVSLAEPRRTNSSVRASGMVIWCRQQWLSHQTEKTCSRATWVLLTGLKSWPADSLDKHERTVAELLGQFEE